MSKRTVAAIAAQATRWTEDEAASVVAEWQASGKSCAAYARSIGVQAQRLHAWRRRLAVRDESQLSFVPVVAREVDVERRRVALLVSRGALRIEVHEVDASTAAWVAAVLREGR